MSGHSEKPAKPPLIPSWIVYLIVTGIVLSWLPLALISRSRSMRSTNRPIHLFLDMDIQPKFKAQAMNPAFADHRSERPPIEGTVGRSEGPAIEDDHYFRGYVTDGDGKPIRIGDGLAAANKYFAGFPKQIAGREKDQRSLLLKQGQERFNIYCAVCHGDTGFGDGLIHQRVSRLNDVYLAKNPGGNDLPVNGWIQPANLHAETIRNMPIGQIFNTVSQGSKSMRGYAAQISVEDRWAIVAYVKALQLSQTFPESQLPQDLKEKLLSLK